MSLAEGFMEDLWLRHFIHFIPVGNVLARQLIRDRLIKEWGNPFGYFCLEMQSWGHSLPNLNITLMFTPKKRRHFHEVLGSNAWKRMSDYILNLIPGGFQLSRAYCQWGWVEKRDGKLGGGVLFVDLCWFIWIYMDIYIYMDLCWLCWFTVICMFSYGFVLIL